MYFSKYNTIINLKDYPQFAILHNLFHGQVTLFDWPLLQEIRDASHKGEINHLPAETIQLLKERRFIYDNKEEEEDLINQLYENFSSTLPQTNSSRQYQILLSYDCNLRCVYCFQKKQRNSTILDTKKLNAIFEIISKIEKNTEKETTLRDIPTKVPLVSIVGGEPLQDNIAYQELLSNIIDFVETNKFDYAITTNGVDLSKFVSFFKNKKYFPRDIQVTLDGPKEIHNKRRIKSGGGGSFDMIIESIDQAISADIHISLRINLDRMNVNYIEDIANLIMEKGWDKRSNFYAYLAPVTDHSSVNKNYHWIIDDDSLIHQIISKFKHNPKLATIFNLRNFRGFEHVRKIVAEHDSLPIPTFWRCEAILGQLIFDSTGNIYSCFEGSGNDSAKIGEYYPEFHLNEEKLLTWKNLNSITNKLCLNCKYKFICAGGCPWHIVHQGTAECLPIESEINLAWNYYADQLMMETKHQK